MTDDTLDTTPDEPDQGAVKEQCLSKMREMILLGYSVREINRTAAKFCPWAAKKTIRNWQNDIRRRLSLNEGAVRKSTSINRGIMRQRLEYLFHLCLVPGGADGQGRPARQDPKTALECLKQLMVLDGLSKPPVKKQNNQINIYGNENMSKLPTSEIKRIAEGGSGDRMKTSDANQILDGEIVEDQ